MSIFLHSPPWPRACRILFDMFNFNRFDRAKSDFGSNCAATIRRREDTLFDRNNLTGEFLSYYSPSLESVDLSTTCLNTDIWERLSNISCCAPFFSLERKWGFDVQVPIPDHHFDLFWNSPEDPIFVRDFALYLLISSAHGCHGICWRCVKPNHSWCTTPFFGGNFCIRLVLIKRAEQNTTAVTFLDLIVCGFFTETSDYDSFQKGYLTIQTVFTQPVILDSFPLTLNIARNFLSSCAMSRNQTFCTLFELCLSEIYRLFKGNTTDLEEFLRQYAGIQPQTTQIRVDMLVDTNLAEQQQTPYQDHLISISHSPSS